MARKPDDLDVADLVWEDPTEIPDDEIAEAQSGFKPAMIEAYDTIVAEADIDENVLAVLVAVVSIDKTDQPDADATKYRAAASCLLPPEWDQYEPALVMAAARCAGSLAESTVEQHVDKAVSEYPLPLPDIISLRDTKIERVEDLFELFCEGPLENVPVMFPRVVAEQMYQEARFYRHATMVWPLIDGIVEQKTFPTIHSTVAAAILEDWDDDFSLAVQAMLYVHMNNGPLDELDLSDPDIDLCMIVAKQMMDDLETLATGTPDKLDA